MLNKSVGELMEENSRLAADKMQSDKVSVMFPIYIVNVASSLSGIAGRKP